MNQSSDINLIDTLCSSGESECVEFKENVSDPSSIGKYISALANAAAVRSAENGYLVWGVRDGSCTVTGTTFNPAMKVKKQPLMMWLLQRIKPDSAFEFREVAHPQGRVVLLTIPAATSNPVTFDRIAYIRINGSTPPLGDYPERERNLWEMLQKTSWEKGIAVSSVAAGEALDLIDYPDYFDLTGQPLPDNRDGILDRLSREGIIVDDSDGRWSITNLGAILFAKSLSAFGSPLSHKSLRIIVYDGNGRSDTATHRREEQQGYAVGFNNLISSLNGIIPARETIGPAFRTEHRLYPEVAIREIVANALIHQDMTITQTSPMVEVFHDRIEITNPGKLLTEPERLIDTPPRSRNKDISALMRRMRLCEETGSGIDKAVRAIEQSQSPPPKFEDKGDTTHVFLYAPRRFADMTKPERIRACYQHAALRHVEEDRMTNGTLRERFGLAGQKSSVKASQVIRATLDAGMIKLADPAYPRSGYLPFWA